MNWLWLNFDFHWRWTIRARITHKSAIRTWSNSRGEGKLFSVDLVDESVSNIYFMFRILVTDVVLVTYFTLLSSISISDFKHVFVYLVVSFQCSCELLRNCLFLAGIYLFGVNNRNTRTTCEICWKLAIKTPERRHWRRSDVFNVNFQHISHIVLVFYC